MIVLDASVVIKFFLDEGPSSLKAMEYLRFHLTGRETVAAPDLMPYEVCNTLVFKSHLSDEKVSEGVTSLFSFELSLVPLELTDYLKAAHLARRFHTTVYDAAYVHLAEKLHCDLITADEQLWQKTQALPFVRLLKNV